jgi:hypothetical protein
MRQRDRDIRFSFFNDVADFQFMVGQLESVDQAYRDRLNTLIDQMLDRLSRSIFIQGPHYFPGTVNSLVDL